MADHDDRRIDPVNRRTFLRRLGVAGGTLAVTSRLGATPALAQAETPSPLKVDPAAKRGGTLRYAVHSASAHFDIHQSGTVANIGPQGPMYDNLIRRDPRDGQTIIPTSRGSGTSRRTARPTRSSSARGSSSTTAATSRRRTSRRRSSGSSRPGRALSSRARRSSPR